MAISDSDYGYKEWQWNLENIENRIIDVFGTEANELQTIADGYFSAFYSADEEKRAKVQSGEMSEAEYRNWMLNTVTKGERYQQMAKDMAERAINADKIANSYIFEGQASAYAAGHNYTAYSLDYSMKDGKTVFGTGDEYSGSVDFTLMDEDAVRRLLVSNPQTMPNFKTATYSEEVAVKAAQDEITKAVTSGIIRGSSVYEIADSISARLSSTDRTRSLRAARTALTSAHNGGRQDMLDYAVNELGIEAKKRWSAARDNRTRASHAHLNGVIVAPDKKFPNGLRYPGDVVYGTAAELYNCRCCLTYVLPETKKDFTGKGKYSTGNTVASYNKWKKEQAELAEQRRAARAAKAAQKSNTAAISDNSQGEHKKVTSDGFTDKPSEQFMQDFNDKLEGCSDVVRDMYGNHADQLDVCDAHYKKGAFYRASDDGIFIDEDKIINGDSVHSPMQTAFHEWGHQLDHIVGTSLGMPNGYISDGYKSGALGKAIEEDYNNLAKKAADYLGMPKSAIRSKKGKLDAITQYLHATDSVFSGGNRTQAVYRAYGSVSDIMESQCGKDFPLGVGHDRPNGVSYWNNRGPSREFWAEYCDGNCNTQSGNNMRTLFPNACGICDEIAQIVAYGQ